MRGVMLRVLLCGVMLSGVLLCGVISIQKLSRCLMVPSGVGRWMEEGEGEGEMERNMVRGVSVDRDVTDAERPMPERDGGMAGIGSDGAGGCVYGVMNETCCGRICACWMVCKIAGSM